MTEYLARQKARSKWTEKALLAYRLKKKHIARVRRGLYTSIPRGNKTGTPSVDPYLLASRMAEDAVLAYTHLEGANLIGAIGLTKEQLSKAIINQNTRLPSYLTQPQ